MHCRHDLHCRGLSILEALVLLIICVLLGLVVIPVSLVRFNIWKPEADVRVHVLDDKPTPDIPPLAPAPVLPKPNPPALPEPRSEPLTSGAPVGTAP